MQPVNSILRRPRPATSNASRLAALELLMRRAYSTVAMLGLVLRDSLRLICDCHCKRASSLHAGFIRPTLIPDLKRPGKRTASFEPHGRFARCLSHFANSVNVQDVEAEAPTTATALTLKRLA